MDLVDVSKRNKKAFDYYKDQADKYWLNKSFYMQGMISLALNKFGYKTTPSDIIKSLKEKALHSEEMGMYWRSEQGWFWYQAPIETQALLIEAFDEVANDQESVEEMKVWLLKQKQTQNWETTKATVEAIYALLLKEQTCFQVMSWLKLHWVVLKWILIIEMMLKWRPAPDISRLHGWEAILNRNGRCYPD